MAMALLGGIGLFLLGMLLLTEGLQAAAGDALRKLLARFTRGPFASVTTGIVFTSLVQSSSITTLATIGFVSAGLMTFAQSIGVIFGANLGTTVTSWLVSTIGFNVKLDTMAFPMVGIGAMARLFLKGRIAHLGTTLAGFGLLFIGIETLQMAMADVGDRIDLRNFIREGLGGRLLLVGFGVVMTIVMQSSSAAVATTLTALHAGAIGLDDAAAVVIGQNVGTTAKAALGAIGASLPARRTAVAHIVFNLVTGVIAFAFLPLFVYGADAFADRLGEPSDAVSLAAFHTAFNLIGVALFLPFIGRFAAFIERLLPDEPEPLLLRLEDVRGAAPEIALEGARKVLVDVRELALESLQGWYRGALPAEKLGEALGPGAHALVEVRRFVGGLAFPSEREAETRRLEATFHAIDHLGRLYDAGLETQHAELAARSETLADQRGLLAAVFPAVRSADVEAAEQASHRIAAERKRLREDLLGSAARGQVDVADAELRLSTSRWMDRVAYHFWRSLVHLTDVDAAAQDPAPPESVAIERAP